MSLITIHCRLTTPESTRHQLWDLMAEKNTPLINELLSLISGQEDFEQWCRKGWLPAGLVKKLGVELRQDSRFKGQPGRFYTSAINHVENIYKSFLQTQPQLRFRLKGQERWLQMLKSDKELAQVAAVSLDDIRQTATGILNSYAPDEENLSQKLFNAYDMAKDTLTQAAICLLLKNGCRLPKKEEDPDKFKQRHRKAEIKLAKLQEQVEARRPLGRDLNDRWINALLTAASTIPQDNSEARDWQDQLLQKPAAVPYPLTFVTNEDLTWSKDAQGRLCVKFNGLGTHTFKIYCDRRQLKWLERFYQDQEIKRQSQDKHSSALFTLRSGMLAWQKHDGKEQPWQRHRLTLSCSLDTRFWSVEGTEIIREQKETEIKEFLTRMKDKADLTKSQEDFIARKQSTLARLNQPFSRPSKPLYHGQCNILLSVAMTIDKPATVAIVNIITGKAITYRSFKQLLGDDYHLFNHQRKQKQRLVHLRKNAQRQQRIIPAKDAELGQYLDRLLAKSIVNLAILYRAGSIVLPDLSNIGEAIESEVSAKAESKIPGCIEAQKKYAKEYRRSIHQWSYGRLIDSIKMQASQHNIATELVKQSILKVPAIIAKEMALIAYKNRTVP